MPKRRAGKPTTPAKKSGMDKSTALAVAFFIIVVLIVVLAVAYVGPDLMSDIGPTPGKTSVVSP